MPQNIIMKNFSSTNKKKHACNFFPEKSQGANYLYKTVKSEHPNQPMKVSCYYDNQTSVINKLSKRSYIKCLGANCKSKHGQATSPQSKLRPQGKSHHTNDETLKNLFLVELQKHYSKMRNSIQREHPGLSDNLENSLPTREPVKNKELNKTIGFLAENLTSVSKKNRIHLKTIHKKHHHPNYDKITFSKIKESTMGSTNSSNLDNYIIPFDKALDKAGIWISQPDSERLMNGDKIRSNLDEFFIKEKRPAMYISLNGIENEGREPSSKAQNGQVGNRSANPTNTFGKMKDVLPLVLLKKLFNTLFELNSFDSPNFPTKGVEDPKDSEIEYDRGADVLNRLSTPILDEYYFLNPSKVARNNTSKNSTIDCSSLLECTLSPPCFPSMENPLTLSIPPNLPRASYLSISKNFKYNYRGNSKFTDAISTEVRLVTSTLTSSCSEGENLSFKNNSSRLLEDQKFSLTTPNHANAACEGLDICRTTTKSIGNISNTYSTRIFCTPNKERSFFLKQKSLECKSKSQEDVLKVESALQPFDNKIPLEDYAELLSQKSSQTNNKNAIAQWNYEVNMTVENYRKLITASSELLTFQRRLNKIVKPLVTSEIQNTTLLRQLRLLFVFGKANLKEEKVAELDHVLNEMQNIFDSAVVIKRNSATKLKLHPDEQILSLPLPAKPDTPPSVLNKVNALANEHPQVLASNNMLTKDIENIMATSQDPEELKYYWTNWRDVTARKTKLLFNSYVIVMNHSANMNGFSTAGEMWIHKYETYDMMHTARGYWEDIRPLYQQLHAYVRNQLQKHFGKELIGSSWDPLPAHLVGDMWGQTWKNLFNLTAPYPDKMTESLNEELKKQSYSVAKMAQKVEAFYHSLGFIPLRGSFWKNSIFEVSNKVNKTCEATAWDMHDGHDFRIKMSATIEMEDFYRLHHAMAHIQYFIQYSHLTYPFRDGPCPAFHEAIAGALSLSIHSFAHLNILGLLQEPWLHSDENDINYLFKLALDKVASLPFSYIVDLWRYRVFEGKISSDEYNSKWWELRLQYQGLIPPVLRSEDDFDIGSKYHITSNMPFLRHFLGTIMAFQFHEALCKRAGHKEPLHKCDISSSTRAGEALKKVMSLGASDNWRIVMETITDSHYIDSSALLRFFEPLNQWLQKENSKLKSHIGWEERMSKVVLLKNKKHKLERGGSIKKNAYNQTKTLSRTITPTQAVE